MNSNQFEPGTINSNQAPLIFLPAHPEHEGMLEWIGDEFDPEAFDLETSARQVSRWVRAPAAKKRVKGDS
ncbi:MAG: hypothetical protein WB870_07935 [Gallionellaceae bacterium]